MNKVLIRKVVPEDARLFILLRNMVWRDAYKNIFPLEVFDAKDSRAEMDINNFNQKFYNDNKVITYVAEVDNKIVGILWGGINSEYKYFNDLGYAQLFAMYIYPDYQGLGIGSKFKNVFKDWAKENGATKFVIGVLKENEKARKVYEKWGGTLNNYTFKFVQLNKGYEEVFYTYDL